MRRARDHRRAARAMTLVEVLVALMILALLITLVQLSVDGINVPWRLRGAAHQVESVAQWALNAAATRGRTVQVLYDVAEGTWWVRMDGSTFAWRRLPPGVRFVSVRFADGTEVRRDVAAVSACADGTFDAHVVTLEGAGGERAVMAFDRLTGEMDYAEKMSGTE